MSGCWRTVRKDEDKVRCFDGTIASMCREKKQCYCHPQVYAGTTGYTLESETINIKCALRRIVTDFTERKFDVHSEQMRCITKIELFQS